MMSASPAWKPQATLTEVASSIMAASLPISHGPKLSPRSQLRSMVVMSVPLREWIFRWSLQSFLRQRVRGRRLPRPGVDRADGAARDVSISECLDVEIEIIDGAEPVGQGAQQFRKLPRLALRLRHAHGLEPKSLAGRSLREPPEIGRDQGRDLGIATAGAAVRHQHDRRTVAGHLDTAVHRAVGDDVVAVQMFDHRTFQAITHAIAGRRDLPFAVQKEGPGFLAEFIVLRTPHHADRTVRDGGKLNPPLSGSSGSLRLQFVAGLKRTRVGAAEAGA